MSRIKFLNRTSPSYDRVASTAIYLEDSTTAYFERGGGTRSESNRFASRDNEGRLLMTQRRIEIDQAGRLLPGRSHATSE